MRSHSYWKKENFTTVSTNKLYTKKMSRIKNRSREISSMALKAILNGDAVRDTILKGMKATQASAYFWGNATQAVQDSSRGGLTVHSGRRLATTGFKATKDFGSGDLDPVCGTLCTVSACCERVRDLCVRDSNNPLYK